MTLERPTARPTPVAAVGADLYFADHYLPVMRLCMRHLRDESDAEDAVQEVFRRAVQQRTAISGDPLPWLITVAKNVCRDELRRRRNGRAALERTAALAPTAETAAPGVEDNPERLVVGRLFVDDLLARLTPAERRVVAARVYDGATGVDVARVLGTSSSTARVLLARARQKLRRYLEEGQATLALLPAFGLRAFHSVRRHLLERPMAAEASAAMLLPVALLATVMMGPGTLAGGGAAGGAAVALGGAGAVHDARATVSAAAFPGTVVVHRQAAAHPPSGPDPAAPARSLLPPLSPDVDRTQPIDVEPSPNYSTDHTVFMLGAMSPACLPPTCTELFKSTDGGASWTYVGAPGLSGMSLILPPSSFAQDTFYAWGPMGLQMTTNGGQTFLNTLPPLGGFAVAAPAWSGLGVLLSNNALWRMTSGPAPEPLSPFSANQSSAGPPLTLPDGRGGWEVLQPTAGLVSINGVTSVLRCTPVCGQQVALPSYSPRTMLVASPNFSADQTIFALGQGNWLSVSHNGGRSFGPARSIPLQQLVAVPSPTGRRLVGIFNNGPSWTVQFSDDDGATWHNAAVDPSLHFDYAAMLGSLGNGRLIASMEHTNQIGYYGFACSADGSIWTACGKETG